MHFWYPGSLARSQRTFAFSACLIQIRESQWNDELCDGVVRCCFLPYCIQIGWHALVCNPSYRFGQFCPQCMSIRRYGWLFQIPSQIIAPSLLKFILSRRLLCNRVLHSGPVYNGGGTRCFSINPKGLVEGFLCHVQPYTALAFMLKTWCSHPKWTS